jgi:catechol 2,3-dioxygenase-like lactoylglutathione lyase family enzyme
MDAKGVFKAAFPYEKDILALPVTDLNVASEWYCKHFGMVEVERRPEPPTVILERDGTRIGFQINGGDATQDGAAVLCANIKALYDELTASGAQTANWRVDTMKERAHQVFFVVAPDGLCYYFHEPIDIVG